MSEELLFDKAVALEALDGDESIFEEMVDIFLDLIPSIRQELSTSIENSNWEELKITAHTLKNRALYVGSQRISDHAKEIELLCKNNSQEQAAQKIPAISEELIQLEQILVEMK